VALNQYEKLERNSGNEFKPETYERKELICDMEKASNILRSVKQYLQNHK